MALVIPIAVDDFLINIVIGRAKDPTNNNILRAVKNETPSEKIIKIIVRRAQQHCYKDAATNLDSGMPLALEFDKGKIGGIGYFVKDETTFDHYADKITLIRLNSDSSKEKYGEDAEEIDDTLCDVDIYCKDEKKTKYIGQCNDYGGGGVTKGSAEGLSAVRKQDDAVYYVDECMLHAASKLLQNDTEKTFVESGLGEETLQKFLHT